jgi:mannose-1-phosphate guanylyltransferase
VIQDEGTFTKAVSDAIPLAESGKLIKLEIVADRPYTGYGYIKEVRRKVLILSSISLWKNHPLR